MRYLKINLRNGGIYVIPVDLVDILVDEVKEGNIGEKWTVEIVEMSEKEFNELPEFMGH